MQKKVKQSDIREETRYVWECPKCFAENVDVSFPVGECLCFSCGEYFEIED